MNKAKGKGDIDNCPNCGTTLEYTGWEAGAGDCSCDMSCEKCDFRGYVSYKADYWEEI
jgi:hypothetical protein